MASKKGNFLSKVIGTGVKSVFKFVNALQSGDKTAWFGAAIVAAVALYRLTKKKKEARPMLNYEHLQSDKKDRWDVAIVGAGPSGATCAYHLAKSGLRVLLLEKKKFPRDKYCGDAVCLLAQRHLKEMGVLQEILAEGKGHYQAIGGFVSPNGSSFIGNSAAEMDEPADKEFAGIVVAVKRTDMDSKIAWAAKRVGAVLTENTTAENFDYSAAEGGWWTVHCVQTPEGSDNADTAGTKISYQARVLICADGAPSGSARKLGIVKTAPEGTCSRAYVKGDSHNFKADGVVFFPKHLLPGYAAIMKHPENELNFCTYIIPGGKARNEDLHDIHYGLIKDDPFISKALGPRAEIEPMRPGALRLGGVPRSSGDHVIVIGDAAGLIDPLTGEGIHFALASGKMGAQAVVAAFSANRFSASFLKEHWDDRWKKEWGAEFYWSMKICLLFYYFPGLLDAAAKYIKRKGAAFLLQWGLVMTGEKSKLWFLRPDIGPAIFVQYLLDGIKGKLGL